MDLAKELFYTALDIGSNKVASIVARVGSEGELKVLGTGLSASHGIQKGQIDSAADHFQQVLQINPRVYQMYVQLGLIEWQHRNNRFKARDHLQKALEIANDIRAKKHIAQLIARLSEP